MKIQKHQKLFSSAYHTKPNLYTYKLNLAKNHHDKRDDVLITITKEIC